MWWLTFWFMFCFVGWGLQGPGMAARIMETMGAMEDTCNALAYVRTRTVDHGMHSHQ